MDAKSNKKYIRSNLIRGSIYVKYFPPIKGVRDFTATYPVPMLAWDIIFLALVLVFISCFYRPDLLFSPTIISGGDTVSHYFTARYFNDFILPAGKISGWCQGNLAGFPMLQYYFPLPFIMIAGLSSALGLPVAFKLVTVLGVFLLPLAVYLFFRLLRQPFPAPIIGACFSLVFLFLEANKMWGGNIPSTLAGEFCYGIGFSLSIIWLGLVFRAMEKNNFANIVICAVFLAVVGLSHAYALLFAGMGSGFFLFTRTRFTAHLNTLLKIHGLAFCLLGFWILPLMANLPWTTKFSILWIFHSWDQVAKEIFPVIMRPMLLLTIAAFVAAIISAVLKRSKSGKNPLPFVLRPMAYIWSLIACALIMYVLGYRARVVDIRFLPFFQLFLIIGGAALFKGFSLAKGARKAPVILVAIVFLSASLWVDKNETFIQNWIESNYKGLQTKPLWPAYKAVNKYLSGDCNDPRVIYEHSMIHQGAGSVRAFENLPLFSGRSTLEGVYIQASVSAPFVFYIQSETSLKPSTPIPEVFYSRMDIQKAVKHLKFFNVSQFIAAEEKTKLAIDEGSDFTLEFAAFPYRVYHLNNAPNSYVKELSYKPALMPVKNWVQQSYKWFRLSDLDVVPVFADKVAKDDFEQFMRVENPEMRALPKTELPGPLASDLAAEIMREEIIITGAAIRRPLLIKVSYHPGWKVSGAKKIYLAGPGFMLVYPQSSELRLVYGPTFWDFAGKGLTALAILWILACVAPFLSGPVSRLSSAFNRHAYKLAIPMLFALMCLMAVFLFSKSAPEFPAVPYNKGLEYFTAGDYAKARNTFEYVMEKHGQSLVAGEAAYHLAMCFYREKDYENTVASLDRILALYPETPRAAEILYHKGLCLKEIELIQKAGQAFDKTVNQFPSSMWARLAAYQQAMIYFRARELENTLKFLDRLFSLDPELLLAAEAWYHVGLCKKDLGKIPEARQAFNRVMEKYPATIWAGYAKDRLKEF